MVSSMMFVKKDLYDLLWGKVISALEYCNSENLGSKISS